MTGLVEQPDGRDRAIADWGRLAHHAAQVGSQYAILLIGDKGIRDEERPHPVTKEKIASAAKLSR